MDELVALAIGLLLLIAALVRSGTSGITWLLFRLRLSRLLTVGLALLLISAVLIHLKSELGRS
ncbi:hypothetical protein ACN28C_10895 [Plantactinospora sp. WMMC1484]|uniref:hypothetical protein n=1 Tax=Plantactinospora sp. WMMC1484 TaxID=3404122 RepID=UPI003BF472F7